MTSTPAPAPASADGSGPPPAASPAPPPPDSTTEPDALIEQRGPVLIVTMNRPAARNALTGPMMALMRQAWDQVDSDPGIRVSRSWYGRSAAGSGSAICRRCAL